MLYYFIINGRDDIRQKAEPDVMRQLEQYPVNHLTYFTEGVGDGTRFVHIYCDLHQKDEVCFIACGGCGTLNEVASGIAGFENKSMAFMAYGATNDFIKHFPGRNFNDLKAIIEAPATALDIVKANDAYCINVINIGFGGMVVSNAVSALKKGKDPVKAYKSAIITSLLSSRINHIKVTVDGKRMNKRNLMLCDIGNGSWCGGQYLCSPKASIDDGLMEVSIFFPMLLAEFAMVLKHYVKGTYLDSPFYPGKIKYKRAKHVELDSHSLIYASLDGELYAATHYDIDVLQGAIQFRLPPLENENK